MTRIVAISGSLRKHSFNTALVNSAAKMFPDNVRVGTIAGIPPFNEDLEDSEGIPDVVARLKNEIAQSDGLLISTPEYNNGVPGVLKNAIDWATRPFRDVPKVFHGKPVAVIGASPGGFGTTLAQTALLPVLRTLKTDPWFAGRLMVSHAGEKIEEGVLQDEETRERLEKFVGGFIEYCGG